MANVGKWGKMRPETLRFWLDLFSPGQARRKEYLAFLVALFRSGDNLASRERGLLSRWLSDNGRSCESLGDLITVQYSHGECAAALSCDKRQSLRLRDWALRAGVLVMVDKGSREHAALFLVARDGVTQTGENVPPTDNDETECGDISSQMGGHSESNDLRLGVPIQSYPDISTSNVNPTCIKCGAGDLTPLGHGLALCRACDTAQPLDKGKGLAHACGD